MSALARIMLQRKALVSGSDLVFSLLMKELEKEGIRVFAGHSEKNVPDSSLVIFSTVIDEVNPEIKRARDLNLELKHRSELLASLCLEHKSLLVAGCHGKTTTSALLAHLLMQSKADPSFAVGGILNNYNTNGRQGARGGFFVVESDESDGSFLKLKGYGGIVTNIDFDHMEYWKKSEYLISGYEKFFENIASKEHFFYCKDDPLLAKLQPKGVSYGFSLGADLVVSNLHQRGFSTCFDIAFEGKKYCGIELNLSGEHNAQNGAAVFGLALRLGIREEHIRQAFSSFSGIMRRLTKKKEHGGVLFLDDYGHHPKEISSTLAALRKAVGKRRLVVLFQPHRYTRTRDLYREFLTCFKEADILFCTDIYPASERPIEGVTANKLAEEIARFSACSYISKKDILSIASFLKMDDVFLSVGAGDVTKLQDGIIEKFCNDNT